MDDDPAGVGHNRPPPTPREELFARCNELIINANRWRAERPAITDVEMAGAAARFIKQLREERDALKAMFAKERKPIDLELAHLRQTFNDVGALIEVALNGVVKLNTAWLQEERDRLDAERRRKEQEAVDAAIEANRLRDAAASAGATVESQVAADRARRHAEQLTEEAVAIPDRPRIRDDMTDRAMTLRQTWKARVTDERVALQTYRNHPDVVEAARLARLKEITRIATLEAKSHKDRSKAKAGVEFYVDETAT